MKAILVREYGEPETMKLEDASLHGPAAGQMLVKIEAVGVNPVECYVRAGLRAGMQQLPYTPGTDGAGRVLAVGAGVNEFAPGDRVYLFGSATGTYAENALCELNQVYKLPENISFEQGAALGIPYATAWRALFQLAHMQKGETVLVHGATGGVGLAAVQLASTAGYTVIGTAGSEAGKELILKQGAHFAIDHGDTEAVRRHTDNRGADVVLEMLANKNLTADLQMAAQRARVIVIGSRGSLEIDPRMCMAKDVTIRGMLLFNANAEELAAIHAGLYTGLENGTLKPVISKRFPLVQAPAAHHAVMESSTHGKIILLP